MQKKWLGLSLLLGAAVTALLIPNLGIGQQKGGPGGKKGMMGADPDKFFDFMARGSDAIVISNVKGGTKDALQQWANENGITNGLINRAQFGAFSKYYQDKIASGQTPGGFGGGKGFGGKGGGDPEQFASDSFKKWDKDGNGKLTPDEMSEKLKAVWQKYDKNNNGYLTLDDYKAYLADRSQQFGGNNNNGNEGAAAIAVMIEEEWDKRPVVFRAGKLPKELPPWFVQLDTDNDGQVGYYEWRKSGKSFEEFNTMDRNGDGLLTAEEVLWYLKIHAAPADGTSSASESVVAQGPAPSFNAQPRFNNNNGPSPFNKGPGGPGGKKGPGGDRKKGGKGNFGGNNGG